MSALWSRFGVLNSESGDSSIWGRFGVLSAGVAPITVAGVELNASFSISLGTVVLGGVTIDSSTAVAPTGSLFQLAIGTVSGALTLSGNELSSASSIALGTVSGALTLTGPELSNLTSISGGTIVLGGTTIAGVALDSSFGIAIGSSGGVTGPALSVPYTIPLGSVVLGGVTITGPALDASYLIFVGRGGWVEDSLFSPAPIRRVRPVVELEDYQLVYPFELPLFSQRTIERDRTLSAWNNDLQKWWANVRKNLKATVGSASAVEALEKQVAELQALLQQTTSAPPAIVTKHFGGSTNKWEYRHQRGVRPIVTAWVMHPTYGYATLEGHQYEDVALNTTTIEWDANYNGHAVYAFPSVTV